MKLYFSNYRYHWYSPYKIIEKAMFWKKDFDAYENEPPKWLTNICVGIRSVLDFVHPEIKYIKVDPYDSWNADGTLTRIILPLLKQLKEDPVIGGKIMGTLAHFFEEQGIAKGISKEKKEIAISMLEEGSDPKFISRITKLPLQEVIALKEQHNDNNN